MPLHTLLIFIIYYTTPTGIVKTRFLFYDIFLKQNTCEMLILYQDFFFKGKSNKLTALKGLTKFNGIPFTKGKSPKQ